MGRHSSYTDDIADRICERVALGEPLKKICHNANGMPDLATVYRWLGDPARARFRDLYTRAKEDAADALADEIQEIADTVLPELDDGRVDAARVNQLRLQVDARKWIAAKLKPKKYGDRQEVEHSGKLTLEQLLEQSRQDTPTTEPHQ